MGSVFERFISWREDERIQQPEIVLFVTNTHPGETAAPVAARLVKRQLKISGFNQPIEIIRLPDTHQTRRGKIKWYRLAAMKGMNIRDDLRDTITYDRLKSKGIRHARAAIFDFHNGVYRPDAAIVFGWGSWRYFPLEIQAIFTRTKNPEIIQLAQNQHVIKKLGKHDIRYYQHEVDLEATRSVGLLNSSVIDEIANLVREVTSTRHTLDFPSQKHAPRPQITS